MSQDDFDSVESTLPLKKLQQPIKNIEVGDLVAGRYKVLRHLDKGGMGMIFEAEQQPLGRIVALKVMHAPGDQEGQLRFHREASVAAKLQHPHTVRIFDYGTTESGALFLVMELLQGHTFKSEFKEGPIDPLRLIRIMRQICGALSEAHDKRIIHRDIKPSNIFITHHDSGFAKLLDFGLVKTLDGQGDLSQTGIVLGSPLYMSPEQVDAETIDQRSDIYSLGKTLYHAACGKPPFVGSLSKILMAQLVKTPPLFSEQTSSLYVPPLLEWIIFTCIQKEVAQRFQDTAQLKKALEICEESLVKGLDVVLQIVDGALVHKDGSKVDVARINKTEIYVRPTEKEIESEQEDQKRAVSYLGIAMGILVPLCILGVWFFVQSPVGKESVVHTKMIIQTQLVQVEAAQTKEHIIQSAPQGAEVYGVGDTTPFCTTPCPPIVFKEGEERVVLLKKSGYEDEKIKLIWNMESAVITLSKKISRKKKNRAPPKVKTKTATKTVIKTEIQTQTKTKKDGGLLKDPFGD